MKLLLDTHSFLWFVNGDAKLSKTAHTMIEDERHSAWVSLASTWEMAIKSGLGKLELEGPLDQFLSVELARFNLLPISLDHTIAIASLPQYHRDPFDRMLVAQCVTEGMTLISRDVALDPYGIRRIWEDLPMKDLE